MKRYEYWGSVDGVPRKMYTNWFPYEGEQYKWQLKGKLKNEYRD